MIPEHEEFPGLLVLNPSKQFTATVVPNGTKVALLCNPIRVPFFGVLGVLQKIAKNQLDTSL